MPFVARQILITGILAVVAVPAVGGAQTSAARSKLVVTVADPSGAVIPAATVTVVSLEPAGKAVAVPAAKTGDNGSVTFERLVPGRYSINFNWRRLALNGSYSFLRARRNALGPFDVPASGTLDTEWGKGPADNPYRVNVALTSTQLRNLSANLSVNASDGFPYNLMTGFDNNQDGLLNDRPAGVGIWSLRTTPVWTVSGRFTYNVPLGATSAQTTGGGSPPQRYRLSIYLSVNNLTNHANLSGFSGVMTSPFFMNPTGVQNPRKVDMGMNISF